MVKLCKLARVMLVSMMLLACAACGGDNSQPIDNGTQFGLPWPPAEDSLRSVSDDVFNLKGDDYDAIGPNVVNGGFPANSILMTREFDFDPYPWATYSLSGFGSGIDFGGVSIDFTLQPDPDAGTTMYFGMANYALGYWEWTITDTTPFEFTVTDDSDYVSGGGSVHIAVVLIGTGRVYIEDLGFTRNGNTALPTPTNLQAVAERDLITLTWDPIVTSEGFHVYRDTHKSFPAPEKLTDGAPLTDPTYEDEPPSLERGIMYFYRVTNTEMMTESPPSDYVDIYAPESTRPMPFNLSGYSTGPDTYIAQWSWSGSFPNNFRIYYSDEPDFNLTTDLPTLEEVSGVKTDATLDLSKFAGTTVYWRIAAYQSTHGQMTDDRMGESIEVWEWTPVEVVGNGATPFHAIKVDGDLSVAYRNAGAIDFSRRTAGTWSAEQAIPGPDKGGFVGLSYSGTEYAVAAQHTLAHDLWAGYGTPGSWSSSLLHGDGATGLGHPASGVGIQLASTGTTHYLVHYDPGASLMLHTKPSGSGSWGAPTNLWASNTGGNPLSLVEDSGNIFLLWYGYDTTSLYLADRDGGWATSNVFDTGTTGFGEFINLVRFDGDWWSNSYNTTAGQRRLDMHHGSAIPWSSDTVRDTGQAGEFGKLVALDTKLACCYLRRDADIWELAIYDGATWEISPLVVPGVDSQQIQIMGFGDDPFIVFDDLDTGEIKAAPGTPPTP